MRPYTLQTQKVLQRIRLCCNAKSNVHIICKKLSHTAKGHHSLLCLHLLTQSYKCWGRPGSTGQCCCLLLDVKQAPKDSIVVTNVGHYSSMVCVCQMCVDNCINVRNEVGLDVLAWPCWHLLSRKTGHSKELWTLNQSVQAMISIKESQYRGSCSLPFLD